MTSRAVIAAGVVAVATVAASAMILPRSRAKSGAEASASASKPRADTATARLTIEGMTCGGCATTARIALQRVRGVYRAMVWYDSASAVVQYDATLTRPEVFMTELARLTGYRASLLP
jgi:copper chaperone